MRIMIKFKLITIAIILVMSIPTMVFANTPAKTIPADNVEVLANGQEAQYFKDRTGKIFKNLPLITRTLIADGNGTNTVKYDVNDVTNITDYGVEHKIVGTGSFVSATNVVAEGEFGGGRILYVKRNTDITFSDSTYLGSRKVIEFSKFNVSNGRLNYLNYHVNTIEEKMYTLHTDKTQVFTLDKTGLYQVETGVIFGVNLRFIVYVADENEDLTYKAPKNEAATATTTKITVNKKSFNVPAYIINGENYIKIRDIATIIDGTEKQFDIAYDPGTDTITIKYWAFGYPKYQPVGGELKALAVGNKTAAPSKQNVAIDGFKIYPLLYTVDSSNFIRLRDMGIMLDFNVTWDNETRSVLVDTTTGYVKP